MQPNLWQATIGLCIVACLFGSAAFVAYLLYGPGFSVSVPDLFLSSRATSTDVAAVPEVSPAPVPVPTPVPSATVSLDNQVGALFVCDAGKTLKALFEETAVRLALSDGRILTLPRTVTAEGEIRYENADGSFAFLNREHTVLVEENDVVAYADCTAN